jgi:isocitrate/isopropylmalate dehydrogenase
MMLEHLGETEAAESILSAVIDTLAAGKVRTADMGGQHKTYEMGDAVTQAMTAK